ncbi:hypothetical protein DO71_6086 [Burkholderia pseudomallei]|nr:hypothetical protein DO71_6086 [Burkholderia pseudomallei]
MLRCMLSCASARATHRPNGARPPPRQRMPLNVARAHHRKISDPFRSFMRASSDARGRVPAGIARRDRARPPPRRLAASAAQRAGRGVRIRRQAPRVGVVRARLLERVDQAFDA